MTETKIEYRTSVGVATDNSVVELYARKMALLALLNRGIVVKAEWDDLLRDLRNAGSKEVLAQLQRYYQHYRIGDMGKDLPEPLFEQEEEPEPEPVNVCAQTSRAAFSTEYIPWRESLKVWYQALTELRKSGKIPPADFDTWIRSLRPGKMETGHITIKAINKFCKAWVEEHALYQLREVFAPSLGESLVVEIVVDDKP